MARFDIYRFDSSSVPLVLDVQADLLADLNSCVVIPLVLEEMAREETLSRLKPLIKVEGRSYILVTTDIGTVARRTLGKYITNIETPHRQEIIEALDFLFQGF
ncbi:MAG: plasmid maintenance protein CcdB [Alphaproteobacteria bacterium CG_4_9_14_3_um_filter_47_13]|nr:MAG: plasmid maintenance protein CcdB [Alphaproteobacteria bacterium CG_4_9_14_3_um_filter_47_13]